jgi:acyl carrier protein
METGQALTTEAIRAKVKQIIANVAGRDAAGIGDHATLGDDLGLDSLSRIEIGVDVDYAFKLKLADDAFKEVASIDAMVALVETRLAELGAAAGVAGVA